MKITEDFNVFTKNMNFVHKVGTIFFNPNFKAVLNYRIGNFFYRHKMQAISKLFWYRSRVKYSIDIDYRADLAGGLVIVHGIGTIIGCEVISKGKLIVYQGVTIGGGTKHPLRLDDDGKYRGQPLFEGDCTIYADALVLGGIRIASGSKIKAKSIVTNDFGFEDK